VYLNYYRILDNYMINRISKWLTPQIPCKQLRTAELESRDVLNHDEYKKQGLIVNTGEIANKLRELEKFIPSQYLRQDLSKDEICMVGRYLASSLPPNDEIDPIEFVLAIKNVVKVLQKGFNENGDFVGSSLFQALDKWCHNKVIIKIPIIAKSTCSNEFAKAVARYCAKYTGVKHIS